ncbi:hypothetical protein G6F37_000926 [Rhizopus arrhizus]|nr:hypothetical protein G6F38_004492 [Rhizopus arrhizus]KAG1163730.1 hypothetical protein G6F37_000926 [Rhizopus arrhizus]
MPYSLASFLTPIAQAAGFNDADYEQCNYNPDKTTMTELHVALYFFFHCRSTITLDPILWLPMTNIEVNVYDGVLAAFPGSL